MSFIKDIKNEILERKISRELTGFRSVGMTYPRDRKSMDTRNFDTLRESELKEFISGVFLASAQSSICLRESKTEISNSTSQASEKTDSGTVHGGYHLEFVFESIENAREFCDILAIYEILPKLTERKGTVIIYIKSGDDICNLLALVGASKSLLQLSDEIVTRGVRNTANRRANCDTANIEKQVMTAHRQVEIIRELKQNGGFSKLDSKLQKTALARLDNPEATYEELGTILGITKSGVVHRLRRLSSS